MTMTTFERVRAMNTAFGNPQGDPHNIDWARVRKQCLNMPDEVGELFIALGADAQAVRAAVAELKRAGAAAANEPDLAQVRDALCDTKVFADGAHHLMGINADADMHAVVNGVMTRFIKDETDKRTTILLHGARGVHDVYFEGAYPTMVMKSGSDQPDAPKGKFLKSASYCEPILPAICAAP